MNLALPAGRPAGGRWGILVGTAVAPNAPGGGNLSATVVVQRNIDRSKIIARTLGFVEVGRRLTGAIIEYGRDAGDPPTDTFTPGVRVGFWPATDPTDVGLVGMTGSNCPPVDLSVPGWWWNTPDCDGQTFDGLIRLIRVKSVEIKQMTLERAEGGFASHKPRVEVVQTQVLDVGKVAAGSIWSGKLEYASGTPTNDPGNDYTQILNSSACTFGCVSPTADIWLETNSVAVACDQLGELFLRGLPSAGLVTIGGTLGDSSQACGSSNGQDAASGCANPAPAVAATYPLATDPGESSPRGFPGGQVAPKGRVRINDPEGDPDGFAGQVSVNSAFLLQSLPTSDALSWKGSVLTKQEEADPQFRIDLRPDSPNPLYVAPLYPFKASALGMGAVGAVPYALHELSCAPQLVRNSLGRQIVPVWTIQNFRDLNLPIRLRFYGPVQFDPATVPLSIIEETDDGPVNRTSLFRFEVVSFDARFLDIVPNADDSLLLNPLYTPRRYVVRPTASLLCARTSLIGQPTVPVRDFQYAFDLIYDCDGDGQSDASLIASAPCLDCYDAVTRREGSDGLLDLCTRGLPLKANNVWTGCTRCTGSCQYGFPADFNGDGQIRVDDIFAYLSAWFAARSCADANRDGTRTVADIFAYLSAWFAACPCQLPNCPTANNCP
ncbi:MAG: hypothetical protein K2Q20_13780 [Phycisphaerales bacterium]|nr:hypothetical protein [Phycisphaerales bacterium]